MSEPSSVPKLSTLNEGDDELGGYEPRSVYACDLELTGLSGEAREFVLSDLHPLGFPKRRKYGEKKEKQETPLEASRRAYREALVAAPEPRSAFDLWRRSGARVKVSAANHEPAPGWHRFVCGGEVRYAAPSGEVLFSWRDARKYMDTHEVRLKFDWKSDGVIVEESAFEAAVRAQFENGDKAEWERLAEEDARLAAARVAAARQDAKDAALQQGATTEEADRLAATAHEDTPAAPVDYESDDIPEDAEPLMATPADLAVAKARRPRYNVIEKLERMFGGGELQGESSDDQDNVSYYESDDSFIDDTDIIEDAEVRDEEARTRPSEFDGFFASSGDLATETAAKKETKPIRRRVSVSKGEPNFIKDLVDQDAPIRYLQANPKRGESATRYESYKHATTARQALDLGASKADLRHDFKKGYLTLPSPDLPDLEEEQPVQDRQPAPAPLVVKKKKRKIVPEAMHVAPAAVVPSSPPPLPAKRQRNPSPKVLAASGLDPIVLSPRQKSSGSQQSPAKKPRGRPRKNLASPASTAPPDPAREAPVPHPAAPALPQAAAATQPAIAAPVPTVNGPDQTVAAVPPPKKTPRRTRCGTCEGCLAPECGECKFCLDRPKRGGEGKLRQPCVRRACLRLSGGGKNSNGDSQSPEVKRPTCVVAPPVAIPEPQPPPAAIGASNSGG